MNANSVILWSLLFSSAILTAAPVPARQEARRSSYTVYQGGAWFKIEYPRGWKATSLSRSKTSVTGYDSARFTAPDGSAEFYVFSPQWNGSPQEIVLDPQREVLVAYRSGHAPHGRTGNGSDMSAAVVNWYTAQAKDNSYQRSWVDTEDKALNTRFVFGIKYRNKQVYKKYQAQYTHFCKSLVQYAD